MKAFRFTTPEQYLSYDFDDSHCFFNDEMLEYIEKEEKIDPAVMVDGPQKIADFVKDLFKIYDALIINEDEQRLYGELKGEMVLLKEVILDED